MSDLATLIQQTEQGLSLLKGAQSPVQRLKTLRVMSALLTQHADQLDAELMAKFEERLYGVQDDGR